MQNPPEAGGFTVDGMNVSGASDNTHEQRNDHQGEEYEEQNLCDARRGTCDSSEAQDACDDRNNKK
jgi:hypothetical protein